MSEKDAPFVRLNFIIMAVSAALIVLGFILIAGGATSDGSFNPDVFSTRRIVIGPTMAFIGFIGIGVAIMWPARRSKKDSASENTACSDQTNNDKA